MISDSLENIGAVCIYKEKKNISSSSSQEIWNDDTNSLFKYLASHILRIVYINTGFPISGKYVTTRERTWRNYIVEGVQIINNDFKNNMIQEDSFIRWANKHIENSSSFRGCNKIMTHTSYRLRKTIIMPTTSLLGYEIRNVFSSSKS